MGQSDQELLSVNDRKKEIKNFQAYFYQMNSKAENVTRVFAKDVKICLDDIRNLNRSVAEKFSHYENAGFTINIQLQYYNHKRLYFDSWQSFEAYQWYDDIPILNLAIKWEIMVVLPNFPIPQKHTLSVKMSDQVAPDDLLKLILSGEMEDLADFDKKFFPVYASVDYIDFMICEETLNIVERWVAALPTYFSARSRIFSKIKEKAHYVENIVRYISNIVIFVCTIVLVNRHFQNIEVGTVGRITIGQLRSGILGMLVYGIVLYFMHVLIRFLSKSIGNVFRTYGRQHVFNITNGDQREIENYAKRNSQKRLAILGNVVLTVLINILCGIFVNAIS